MAKSKKPVKKKTTAPKKAVVLSKKVRKKAVKKAVRKQPVKRIVRKKAVKKAVRKQPVKRIVRKKAVKKTVRKQPVKRIVRKKAVKKAVRKQPVKRIVRKKAVKKVVNPKTGRKVTVKKVTDIQQIGISNKQTEQFIQLKDFSFSVLNTGVIENILFFRDEFQSTPTITWGGDTVNVTDEQLLEIVNRLNSSFNNYAKEKKIPSPLIRWRTTISPENGTANLNLDKSFFQGDEDEPFDPSDIFFDIF